MGDESASMRVQDVMVRIPKTLPTCATVAEVRELFLDDHVHMALLADGDRLAGALVRDDLASAEPGAPATAYASIRGRAVDPDELAEPTRLRMLETGVRRLAVVDADSRLLGLLCLKRHGRGFCSDEDVRSRARDTAC